MADTPAEKYLALAIFYALPLTVPFHYFLLTTNLNTAGQYYHAFDFFIIMILIYYHTSFRCFWRNLWVGSIYQTPLTIIAHYCMYYDNLIKEGNYGPTLLFHYIIVVFVWYPTSDTTLRDIEVVERGKRQPDRGLDREPGEQWMGDMVDEDDDDDDIGIVMKIFVIMVEAFRLLLAPRRKIETLALGLSVANYA